MATEKQKRAVDNMVENGGIVSRAMRDAGYSKETAKSPSKLTKSKGFEELCEEKGLTDSLIVESLVEDIKKKPQTRKGELELGAKIKGLIRDRLELAGDKNNPIPISILQGKSNVQSNNGNSKDIKDEQEA